VIVESIASDKPKEGPQGFNLTYTAVGASKPATIILNNG
jgi:hypothetical protein